MPRLYGVLKGSDKPSRICAGDEVLGAKLLYKLEDDNAPKESFEVCLEHLGDVVEITMYWNDDHSCAPVCLYRVVKGKNGEKALEEFTRKGWRPSKWPR